MTEREKDQKAVELANYELLLINTYGVHHRRVRTFQQANAELLVHAYLLMEDPEVD